MADNYQIELTGVSGKDNSEYSRLLSDVFKRPQLFTEAYLRWQYAENPEGNIVGFNAKSGNELAAHYVTMPIASMVQGELKKGLLSLNTATHPDHQGKGLFVKLANQTYQHAAANGYHFVIGVANQNSVHGFIKKLGFQLMGQLEALIGTGPLPVMEDTSKFSYYHQWTQPSLEWRLKNPNRPYGVSNNKKIEITCSADYPLIRASLATFSQGSFNLPSSQGSAGLMKLWIGSKGSVNKNRGLYFNIPAKFRPAPLHLIYKDLSGKGIPFDYEDMYFQALDFDAY